jgi:hypothetical protein
VLVPFVEELQEWKQQLTSLSGRGYMSIGIDPWVKNGRKSLANRKGDVMDMDIALSGLSCSTFAKTKCAILEVH